MTYCRALGNIARQLERLCTLAKDEIDLPGSGRRLTRCGGRSGGRRRAAPVEVPVEVPVEAPVERPAAAEAPTNGVRRSRPGRIPLTEAQRSGIIAARQRQPQPKLLQIAEEFGVSTSSVSNVLSQWRNETGQCQLPKDAPAGPADPAVPGAGGEGDDKPKERAAPLKERVEPHRTPRTSPPSSWVPVRSNIRPSIHSARIFIRFLMPPARRTPLSKPVCGVAGATSSCVCSALHTR